MMSEHPYKIVDGSIVDVETGEVIAGLDGRDPTKLALDRLEHARRQEKLWKQRGGYLQALLLETWPGGTDQDNPAPIHSDSNVGKVVKRTERKLNTEELLRFWYNYNTSDEDRTRLILAIDRLVAAKLDAPLRIAVESMREPTRETKYIRVTAVPEELS